MYEFFITDVDHFQCTIASWTGLPLEQIKAYEPIALARKDDLVYFVFYKASNVATPYYMLLSQNEPFKFEPIETTIEKICGPENTVFTDVQKKQMRAYHEALVLAMALLQKPVQPEHKPDVPKNEREAMFREYCSQALINTVMLSRCTNAYEEHARIAELKRLGALINKLVF